MAVLLITHDLGVIAEMADRVAVMYAGKIVETGLVSSIFNNPKHPYTIGLLNSIPKVNSKKQIKQKLITIPGVVPSPHEFPEGCRFNTRCNKVMEKCRIKEPPISEFKSNDKDIISNINNKKIQIMDKNNSDVLINGKNNDIKQHYANCWLY